jgi:hypothetical protein
VSEENDPIVEIDMQEPINFQRAIDLALAATDASGWGEMKTDDLHALAGESPLLFAAWQHAPGGPLVVAITGNGPTSEANAEFMASARKIVLGMVSEVDRLRTSIRAIHAAATKHNPVPPTPERAAEHRARMAAVDPVLAMARIAKALAPTPASPGYLAEINAAWAVWDDEREPQAKALLQMRLAECVAGLLEHGEALTARVAKLDAAVRELGQCRFCTPEGSWGLMKREHCQQCKGDGLCAEARHVLTPAPEKP